MSDRNITRHSKIFRLQNFVGAGVVENGFGVNSSFVSECGISGDVIVEGNLHGNSIGNQILNIAQHVQFILFLHIIAIRGIKARDKSTKRRDAVSFSNSKN